MSSTIASASALVSALVAGLALVFVWGGTESVYFDWVAMDDDHTTAQLAELRDPIESAEAYSYTNYGESGAMASAPVKNGDNYVLWLNVSGFRADYVEDAETPFFDEVRPSSGTLIPTFPTVHYPSLISQATGVLPSVHGVIGDTMRHPETKEVKRFPTDLVHLKAEPIWNTAKKQGISVLVHDWPFSQAQPAENGADVFLAEYDESKSDEDRLNTLLDAWGSYQGEKKIRLAMASLIDLKKAARANGPKEPDTLAAVTTLDSTLKAFFDKLKAKWPELRKDEGDKLHVVLTTDHGSSNSDKLINYSELMGKLAQQVDYAVTDGIAHLWFKELPAGADQADFEEGYDDELKKRIYWRSYSKGDYPSTWGLGQDGGNMFGDRFLVLKPGYSFTTAVGTEPVFDPSEAGGPYASSGYAVSDSSRMKGQTFMFRLDGGGYGSSLGEINGTQLHSTICKLLKIEPAGGADAQALDVD
tara:strand:+ start:5850 stop:7268 length:1419 start_codon:yes stop_codon:yes gene_type:complete